MIIIPTGARASLERPPVATYSIILTNFLFYIFCVATLNFEGVVIRLAFIMDPVDFMWPLRMLTSMFLHGGLLHLLGNMIFLWVFGASLEDRLGTRWYLVLYFGAGIMGALGQGMVHPDLPMVGASGAVMGLIAAHLIIHPLLEVRILVLIFCVIPISRYISSLFFVPFFFLMQWLSAQVGGETQIAHFAHLGGALWGAAFAGASHFLILPYRTEDEGWHVDPETARAAGIEPTEGNRDRPKPRKPTREEEAADAGRQAILGALLSGEKELAVTRYRQFVETFPGQMLSPPDQIHMGEILRERYRPHEAIAALKPLANHPKELPLRQEAAFLIADIFEKDLRDYEKAHKTLALLLRKFPDTDLRDEVEQRMRKLSGYL